MSEMILVNIFWSFSIQHNETISFVALCCTILLEIYEKVTKIVLFMLYTTYYLLLRILHYFKIRYSFLGYCCDKMFCLRDIDFSAWDYKNGICFPYKW